MNEMTKTLMYYINRMAEIQKRKGEFNEEQTHKQAQRPCVQLMQQQNNFQPIMFHVIAELKDEQAAAEWKEESDITSQLSMLARQRGHRSVDVYMEEQRKIAQYETQHTVHESKQTLQKLLN